MEENEEKIVEGVDTPEPQVELTPEEIKAGEVFAKLVDERGGIDNLTEEDKEVIRAAGGTIE